MAVLAIRCKGVNESERIDEKGHIIKDAELYNKRQNIAIYIVFKYMKIKVDCKALSFYPTSTIKWRDPAANVLMSLDS